MKMPADTNLTSNADYRRFIEELKSRVLSARISAARAITHEAILLYWDIGRGIVEKQQTLGWGESVVELVAKDLQEAFPGTTGFSSFNLWRIRQLYLEYTSPEFLAQVAPEIKRFDSNNPRQAASETSEQLVVIDQGQFLAQLVPELLCPIPWEHHIEIIKKIKSPAARIWYLRATAQFGWSRNVLLNQIKASAFERAVTEKKTHNFDLALPEHFAEQADEMLKSSYSPDFLGLRRAVKERELAKPIIRWEETKKDGKTILGYEILPNKYFYRYQPPTPAKDLLAEFWKLEKDAEKMLEGLAK